MAATKSILSKAKESPIHILGIILCSLLDILAAIVYFPKYLYHAVVREKLIAFDWGNGRYCEFYWPLFDGLKESGAKLIFFFDLQGPNQYGATIFVRGLPRVYADLLDNKVVISATATKFRPLKRTVRVQIFHGFAAFGSGFGREFIDNFDVLFLTTTCQMMQLKSEPEYKDLAKGKQIVLVGCPKIDSLVTEERRFGTEDPQVTIFYGPTWHREISSIIDFLSEIVDICKARNYRLIIKLHPYLYHKHNYEKSGGIDWAKRIRQYQKEGHDILLLRGNKNDMSSYFGITDIFLTDVSGLGFEFVSATGKPIIFLGTKVKIPLGDLRQGNLQKYERCAEIDYRGKIGPVVKEPEQLEEVLEMMLGRSPYEEQRNKFRREFIPNVGSATQIAVSCVHRIYRQL